MSQTVLMRSHALVPLIRRSIIIPSLARPLSASSLRRLSFRTRVATGPPAGGLGFRDAPRISLGRRSMSVRATDVSEPGSIDSPMIQSMRNKIKEQLSADTVIVQDANGDGRHVSIYVVSSAFEGQSAVNRQRMVYKAIREELESTVHAVDQMITRTPAEAA
ncbi:hypothetical protein QJS04_geneDACA012267 [Acorus gramineus]|uniref:BolA protein n=1 Tax=Acorus gramineus TaxID=55184 RepID=A0AAV9BDQ2_ACOGR|nr:hypothetical protein QJS04_geneDACA012267 [Acorus gramineus]